MKNGYQVLFRVDAGPEKGLGHLRRCLALAEAFREEKVKKVGFLTRNPGLVRSWTGRKFGVVGIQGTHFSHEPSQISRLFQNRVARLLILDHYDYGAKAVEAIRKTFGTVAYVDDFGRAGRYPVDAVINQNVFQSSSSYPKRPGLRLFLGNHYTLIPRDILAEKCRGDSGGSLKLFISLGGAASKKSLLRIFRAFSLIQKEIPDGRAFLMRGITLNGLDSVPDGIKLVSPDKIARTMARAHLAISAGGVTSYELACLGVPAILVVTAENEVKKVQALEEKGAAIQLGWIDSVPPERLARLIVKLWKDRRGRDRMRKCGRKLIDGQGAARLARDLKEAFLN